VKLKFGPWSARHAFWILLLLLGCAGARIAKIKEVLQSNPICDGSTATKKFEFTVAALLMLPGGIPITGAKEAIDTFNGSSNSCVNHFIWNLLNSQVETFDTYEGSFGGGFTKSGCDSSGDCKIARSRGWVYVPPKDDVLKCDSGSSFHLVRTKDRPPSFVLCDAQLCEGQTDPTTQEKIEMDSEWCGVVGGCGEVTASSDRTYFKANGIETYSNRFYYASTYSHQPQGVFPDLILKTGFNPGMFMSQHYFSIPERDRPAICKEAGLASSCFDLPGTESIAAFRKSKSGYSDYPNERRFLEHYGSGTPSTSGCQDKFPEYQSDCYGRLSKDPEEKRRWVDAVARDLLTRLSTRISKRVAGDWLIYRIEFDPSNICKYAQTNTNLYTH